MIGVILHPDSLKLAGAAYYCRVLFFCNKVQRNTFLDERFGPTNFTFHLPYTPPGNMRHKDYHPITVGFRQEENILAFKLMLPLVDEHEFFSRLFGKWP